MQILETLTSTDDGIEAVVGYQPLSLSQPFHVECRDTDAGETIAVAMFDNLNKAHDYAAAFIRGVPVEYGIGGPC